MFLDLKLDKTLTREECTLKCSANFFISSLFASPFSGFDFKPTRMLLPLTFKKSSWNLTFILYFISSLFLDYFFISAIIIPSSINPAPNKLIRLKISEERMKPNIPAKTGSNVNISATFNGCVYF